MSTRCQLRIELRQVGADLVADAVQLVAGDAAGHLEHVLAVAERAAVVKLFHRGGQVLELPLLARAVELQQLVHDRQRVPGQVALGVGEVLVEVLDDVQRPVHAPPVAGIGADIRIDARLGRRGEAELLRVPRLEQPAGRRILCEGGT